MNAKPAINGKGSRSWQEESGVSWQERNGEDTQMQSPGRMDKAVKMI
jgi:hypothetical protein